MKALLKGKLSLLALLTVFGAALAGCDPVEPPQGEADEEGGMGGQQMGGDQGGDQEGGGGLGGQQ